MKKWVALLISCVSLITGVLIYFTWRDVLSPLFYYLKGCLPESFTSQLEEVSASLDLPEWVLYAAPDGLWMFALCLIIWVIWDLKRSRKGMRWFIASGSMGILFEFAQAFDRMPGVFDWKDLVAMILGAFLSIFFTIKPE